MSKFQVKVYIVQAYDRAGNAGEIIAVKLTFDTAHTIAKEHAPAKIVFAVADKTLFPNIPEQR